MNAFIHALKKHDLGHPDSLTRGELTTLQVNVGNLCNQNCVHCHIDASPAGANIMPKKIFDDILGFLSRNRIAALDVTGGSPEMNPHIEYFLRRAKPLVDELIVRSNLTVLTEEGKGHFYQLYKDLRVHLVCSLPCYLEENVDAQRGSQVFRKSIEAMRKLNAIGFSTGAEALLDLVYNPVGAHLPPRQDNLEKDYKRVLQENYGINFNRLFTLTNVPIKRFKHYLESQGKYEEYCELLKTNFNLQVVEHLMCKTFLSVGYDGELYDCDFNLALGLALKDEKGRPLTIGQLEADMLAGREIILEEHCFSCAAGSGSSCRGALAKS